MENKVGIEIVPKIFNFILDSSGYKKEDIIESKTLKKEDLNGILNGTYKISFPKLKELDNKFFKRGIPFYFLDEVPKETASLSFRKNKEIAPNEKITLRKYEILRDDVKELSEDLSVNYERIDEFYSIIDKTEEVAEKYRNIFNYDNLNLEEKNESEIFEFLRTKIEKRNVFVFRLDFYKYKKVNFSGCVFLSDNMPKLILVNSEEDKNRIIFTLLHEFAHYLLNKEEETKKLNFNDNNKIERWCNNFASYFLFLKEKREDIIKNFNKDTYLEINSKELKNISKKYKISKFHFVHILRNLNLISNNDLDEFEARYDDEIEKLRGRKGGRGDENTYSRNRLIIDSRMYLGLVYHNYKNKNISYGETLNYLSVKEKDDMVKIFEAIENE